MKLNRNSLQLIGLLVVRDLTLRYRRSFLGIIWTLMNPVITSFVLWTVFRNVFGSEFVDGDQFGPYLVIGVLFISFWNQGLLQAAESIAGNSGILTKIRIDASLFAISNALAAFINFLIGLVPLLFLCLIVGQELSIRALFSIVVGFVFTFFITGFGLLLAIFFIRFEDTRNIVTVLLLALGYLTPIFYPLSILNDATQKILILNPLTSFLEIIRWSILEEYAINAMHVPIVITATVSSIFLGVVVFKNSWPKVVSML